MDEVVEKGFERLCELISETKEKKKKAVGKVKENDVKLLILMQDAVGSIVSEIGQEFIQRAKKDQNCDLYDQVYFPDKMILLGKPAEMLEYRPDNPAKKVSQQFCVISQAGNLFELMFSDDGFIIDTYTSPLSPEDALEFYGYDIMYMLYSAMREYALAQEDVLDAVNLTLGCLQQMDEKQP